MTPQDVSRLGTNQDGSQTRHSSEPRSLVHYHHEKSPETKSIDGREREPACCLRSLYRAENRRSSFISLVRSMLYRLACDSICLFAASLGKNVTRSRRGQIVTKGQFGRIDAIFTVRTSVERQPQIETSLYDEVMPACNLPCYDGSRLLMNLP